MNQEATSCLTKNEEEKNYFFLKKRQERESLEGQELQLLTARLKFLTNVLHASDTVFVTLSQLFVSLITCLSH